MTVPTDMRIKSCKTPTQTPYLSRARAAARAAHRPNRAAARRTRRPVRIFTSSTPQLYDRYVGV